VYLVRVGEPLGAIYGYQVTGLWQKGDTGAACYMTNPADCTPGEYKVADLAGGGPKGDQPDGKITSADRTILGNSQPKFYGGFSNTVTYGRFSLDALFSFVYGNKVINAGNAYGFDPDVNSQGGDPRYGLIDIGSYPRSRVWNLGVRATF